MTETGSQSQPTSPAIPPVNESRSRGGSAWFWGLLGGCLLLFVLLTVGSVVVTQVFDADDDDFVLQTGSRVAVIPVEGIIDESRDIIETLHRYRDQNNVRAIVIRINSPGGSVVPSQEIFEEIRKTRRESGKPIVASLDSVAASGGYYIAVGCDRIVANPGSLTGSIGVIAQWFNMEGLLNWARLKPETLMSGSLKDAGSPYRDLSPEERTYLQNIVSQLHRQFVEAVAEGRRGKMSRAEIEQVADGRVFVGEEARKLKLVDDLGNLQDAVQIAANLAGIRGTPRVLYPKPRRPGLLDLFRDSEAASKMIDRLTARGYEFLYRWY